MVSSSKLLALAAVGIQGAAAFSPSAIAQVAAAVCCAACRLRFALCALRRPPAGVSNSAGCTSAARGHPSGTAAKHRATTCRSQLCAHLRASGWPWFAVSVVPVGASAQDGGELL